MPNTFKNASIAVNTTPGTVVYTSPVPAAIIHTLIISNTTAQPQNVTVQFIDSSAATTRTILNDAPIPSGGSLFFPKPLNLEFNDSIRVVASNPNTLTAYASVLEIS